MTKILRPSSQSGGNLLQPDFGCGRHDGNFNSRSQQAAAELGSEDWGGGGGGCQSSELRSKKKARLMRSLCCGAASR